MFATWRREAIRVVLSLLLLTGAAHAAPRLAGQDADVSALTVSGLSSGGHMAVQFHVAHSASVKGAGVLAAGPYYCAGGNEWTAYFNCMTPRAFTPLPALSKLQAATGSLEKAGRIDSTKHFMGAFPPVSATETGTLTDFDQREFVNDGPHSISLADAGYVYVPAACRTERCHVHAAFHGCRQYAGLVGTAFVRDAGYNRWADAHRLIVLYPQTLARNGWAFDGSFVFI